MSNTRLAILGGGNMGRALLGGLLRHGTRPEHVSVGENSAAAREALTRDFGIQASADNATAVRDASLVVVAVKPQTAGTVLRAIRPVLQANRPLVVSIAAGLRIESLQDWCGASVPVVRAMPNQPALLGAGATGIYAPDSISAAQRQEAERVLQAVGEVVWVPDEDALDVVTALSGSGPAYFFLVAELMAQGACELGLDPLAAKRLATATLHGAGLLAGAADADLARMRAEVTSKGGTTEAAVAVLNAADLKGIFSRALRSAAQRSRELATQFGRDTA